MHFTNRAYNSQASSIFIQVELLVWLLSSTRTTQLTRTAMQYALKNRNYPKGVLFHTDRDIEYTGRELEKLLNQWEFKHSLNCPGHCTDNAFIELFFHSLKAELICRTVYHKAKELRQALLKYINQFYNSVRLHPGLDYLSPTEYEYEYE